MNIISNKNNITSRLPESKSCYLVIKRTKTELRSYRPLSDIVAALFVRQGLPYGVSAGLSPVLVP